MKQFALTLVLLLSVLITTEVYATGECKGCYGGSTGFIDCKLYGLKGIIDGNWESYLCTTAQRWIWKCPEDKVIALVIQHPTETISCN